MKKLIVFDLDGTLAESKSSLDDEMAALLGSLLAVVKVAIISGGGWERFQRQILANLPPGDHLENLSLLPTCGTQFYRFYGDWKKIYSEDFTANEKEKIIGALQQVAEASGFAADKVWGDIIEDRDSQITYSALGQHAPIEEKEKWDPDFAKRKAMKVRLDQIIPEFSVRLGGTTSIDVTKPGIDKAYGIRKLRDTLDVPIDEMIFIGDALFPGGNDYPAEEAGAYSIRVRDPEESQARHPSHRRLFMSGLHLQRLGLIMEPEPGNPQEVEGTLNPAATRGPDGHLYLFPRLVAKGNYSRIGIARVKFDTAGDPCNVERLGIALEPEADYERRPGGGGGCEDPRVTYVEPLGHYVMTYTAYSPTARASQLRSRRTCFIGSGLDSRPSHRTKASTLST